MAVENKFKMNILAASVLMGLSLSAVASGAADKADEKGAATAAKETAPVRKVLSDLTAPEETKDIKITNGAFNGNAQTTLSSILTDKKVEGSVAQKKDLYDTAVTNYTKLNADEIKKITELRNATKAKDTAESGWNNFQQKVSVENDIYRDRLKDLYGGNDKDAYKIDVGGSTIVVDASKDDGETAYGKYQTAVSDLKSKLNDLNTDISSGSGKLDVLKGNDDNAANAKKALARVVAYSNYLDKYNELNDAKLKLDSVRNVVIENLHTFLAAADKDSSAHEAGELRTNLDSFVGKLGEWQEKDGSIKPASEKALADSFKTLANTAGVSNVQYNGETFINLATAWTQAVKDVTNADTKLTVAGRFETNSSNADSANAAINGFGDVLAGITLDDSDSNPNSYEDARNGLEKAYEFLLKDISTGASQDELDVLKAESTGKLTQVNAAKAKLDEILADYQAKTQALQQVGLSRLNILTTQLPDVQKTFYDAQGTYISTKGAYDKSDAKTAYEALYGTLGNEGNSGAIADYKNALSNTSRVISKEIESAESGYSQVADNEKSTQAEKNTALYNLIGQKKALIPVRLDMDRQLLKLQVNGESETPEILKALKTELNTATENMATAKAGYTEAVKGYLDADSAYQKSKSEADATTLANAKTKLMNVVGFSSPDNDLSAFYVNNDAKNGFKQFDALSGDSFTVIKKYNDAKLKLDNTSLNTDIQKSRVAVVKGLHDLASLMPFATAKEQEAFRNQYNLALSGVGKPVGTAEEQSKATNAGKITHYLGSLTSDDVAAFDFGAGDYKSVIVNVDDKGNVTGVKDKFTGKDLYTGSKDKPFTTTVLDIRALELGNGELAATNTITVGEAGSKDKKATPVDVWAKTAGAAATPAVKLSGNLRTATAQLDADGKPVKNEFVRGADQIHLQNVNIHNSFTLADKAKMMADDVAAITSEATEKLNLGQPAEGENSINAWQQAQTALLDSKYDKLKLTGLQIDTTTVNPEFKLTKEDAGQFVNNPATVAPDTANILLDNLNITLQNDSVGGISTAIGLSGTGNHILANGGVFDSGQVTGANSQANVLNFGVSATKNRVDFMGSVLKGDIYSSAAGNEVNLTKGSSLTGNVSGTGDLSLKLDGSTWTGGTWTGGTKVELSNNSVWNVDNYSSSVNSLALKGSNTLNLVNAEGQAQLGGHGFVGEKSAADLSVASDLTSDGKGVTSVLAGAYSPGNLHSLANTGLSEDYKFGKLDITGLAKGGKYALSLESSGAEPYTIGGRLAGNDGHGVSEVHAFASYKTSENRVVPGKDGIPVTQSVTSDADFTSLSAPAELGVYQYAAEKVMDAANNRTNIFYSSTGQLSNSAATAVSLASAPVDVTKLESDSLAKHMNSVRHGKDSGVWLSYYGGETRNTTEAGPEYKLKTNGVMVGADTLTENNWLAGVAVSSARSDMSVMNSSGNLNSYGAQFYLSRRYDSGVFVDGALQFNHFSNTAKARMTDGQQAKADFSGNSYGLNGRVGYAWNSEGFFAEPYVRAAARVFDGEHYALSNGMTVNSNDYKSMLGEVGADLGYQYDISGGYVKPYLHLAALNEFADGNSVRVNNVSLDNSVKGSAFQAGLGAEVKVTDNLGGYAAFDYTKGENTERPWQATVGVNYTW